MQIKSSQLKLNNSTTVYVKYSGYIIHIICSGEGTDVETEDGTI